MRRFMKHLYNYGVNCVKQLTAYFYQRGSIASYASAGIARAQMFVSPSVSL